MSQTVTRKAQRYYATLSPPLADRGSRDAGCSDGHRASRALTSSSASGDGTTVC